MEKNRRHSAEFRLKIVKSHLGGNSINSLAKKWELSTSLIRKWIDMHRESGARGLLPRRYGFYTSELKLNVVSAYKNKGLSLRECCLYFDIPSQSTIVSWVRIYNELGVNGFSRQRGRPCVMKKAKPSTKKDVAAFRLEELEKENLYLKAENEYLKKLDALTQVKQTPQRIKH